MALLQIDHRASEILVAIPRFQSSLFGLALSPTVLSRLLDVPHFARNKILSDNEVSKLLYEALTISKSYYRISWTFVVNFQPNFATF